MERHHAAERHLYPDAISAIKQIQADHPNVIIGAVTDGSANPMLMVFSLMPLFDFTVSWEDDMGEIAKLSQMEQFQELSEVDRSDDLGWIYRLAVEKGKAMSKLTNEMAHDHDSEEAEWCWVHVGDDLAYDVGGSATNGAKTVLVELSPKYGQTARLRVEGQRPPWATESMAQTAAHQKMSLNAMDKVDARISSLSELPEVINELLKEED
jgi:FMN phosphatase YigB (HAD superfamily)